MTKLRILLATVLLSLTFGGILGRKYFTYVLFVAIEPILYPCPYFDTPRDRSRMHLPATPANPRDRSLVARLANPRRPAYSPPAKRKLPARHSLLRPPAAAATH